MTAMPLTPGQTGTMLEPEVTMPPMADEPQLTPEQRRILSQKSGLDFDLDLFESKEVERYFAYFTGPARETFARWLKRSETHLPHVRAALVRNGLPQDLAMLPFAESGYNCYAYSWAGAGGMWQFMPYTGRKYGLAFDLGTTTVVGWLVDLDTGDTLAARAVTNPQNVYGADVISRIGHAGTHEGLRQLQQKILAACNEIIRCLLDEGRVAGDEIYEIVAVGNTTMSHLFLGIDPTFLATAPYVPAFAGRMELEARELGLDVMPAGRVVVLPNIAGYVGSDTVGVMLATDIGRRPGFCLAVDIGTNGEVVLAGRGRLLTCSTAAGPAFEGARIRHGMRAAAGAIEGVRIDGGEVGLEVIDDATPLGICGSGLLDAAAAMVQVGLISPTGRLLPPESLPEGVPPGLKERLRRGKDGTEFVLAQDGSVATGEDIVITQKDIRELQLAKAAIYAGIQVLLKELEVTPEEIDEILLAGAFGNYIKIDSALALGLLPAVAPGRIKAVGNAAGDGARMALISGTARAEASDLARRAGHVELSTWPDFQDEFVNAMYFPKQG